MASSSSSPAHNFQLMLLILVVSVPAFAIISPSVLQTNPFSRNWDTPEPTVCNTFDEAHYCKMITIDTNLNTLAISHKCECPSTYNCPTEVDDTKLNIRCNFDSEKQWNRCFMPCTPKDL